MKLKTCWCFAKWDGVNIFFVIQYIRCFKNFCGCQIFFYIFLLKLGNKMNSLKIKYIILFLTRGLIFIFSNGHIHNVVSTSPNIVKNYVENEPFPMNLSEYFTFNASINYWKFNIYSYCGFEDIYIFIFWLQKSVIIFK